MNSWQYRRSLMVSIVEFKLLKSKLNRVFRDGAAKGKAPDLRFGLLKQPSFF